MVTYPCETKYFPVQTWLPRLLEGWRVPLVVGLAGSHGEWSVMLWRPVA